MSDNKYLNFNGLFQLVSEIKKNFATCVHKHTLSDITDYKIDNELSSTSNNPVQNKVINTELNVIKDTLNTQADLIASKIDNNALNNYYTETEVDTKLAEKAESVHTHNYAGSETSGGAANSANKLNTNAGSATQPVYFANGIPVAGTNTLGKSVPNDAVFTDGKVSQAPTSVGTTNANYRLLLSGSADDTSHTEGARKDPNLYFNPSTGVLTAPIVKLGDATISYDTTEKAIVFNFE